MIPSQLISLIRSKSVTFGFKKSVLGRLTLSRVKITEGQHSVKACVGMYLKCKVSGCKMTKDLIIYSTLYHSRIQEWSMQAKDKP